MATHATVKTSENGAAAPKKIGRPPGPAVPKATGTRPIDYTSWDLKFQKPADFYRYVQGYPERSGLIAYLMRLKPAVDNSLIGNDEISIDRFTNIDEMTAEHVGVEHGRGLYMLRLIDSNRPKGQTLVCRTWFDCADAEKPPKYDPRTLLLADARNTDEINRLLNIGVLVRDAETKQVRIRTDGDSVHPMAPHASMHNGGDFLGSKELFGKLLVNAVDKASAGPAESLKGIIEVAKMLQAQSAPVDLEATIERVMTRMGIAGNAGRPSGLEGDLQAYDRLMGFVDRVRPAAAAVVDAAGAVTEGERPWIAYMPSLLREFKGLLPEVMDGLRELRIIGGPVADVPAAAAPGGGAGAAPAPAMRRAAQSLEQRIEEIAALGIEHMSNGVRGYDFANYVCGFHPGGLEVYQFLEPKGTDGVIGLLATHPLSGKLLADTEFRGHLTTFLDDFFTYDATGGGSAAEAAPAAGAAA
jgi:hypothetical protein